MAGKLNLAEHLESGVVDPVRDIETITTEILEAKRDGGEAILRIGRGLIEAKSMLSHGEWLPWLEERVEFSERAAAFYFDGAEVKMTLTIQLEPAQVESHDIVIDLADFL